ncbi:helix-turn-helix domain-containing protein [Thermococcus sp.]|uniref:helix-turn-helix domain-containing protein n=1 Tax=Thermococcus sp. TaxID=35749 RepID=UPI0019C92D6A|nr:helix-turn-helix domain-containing protein [Thermococcus sp.]MBC7095124.1 ArsR family transcriptional regulator [Thermococcus sp.]
MEEVLELFTKKIKNFELTHSEIKIYSLLLKEELTPRQIAKKVGLSERIVREKLKHLLELGLIERNLIKQGWLGYIYRAKNPKEALNSVFSKMEELLGLLEEEYKKIL